MKTSAGQTKSVITQKQGNNSLSQFLIDRFPAGLMFTHAGPTPPPGFLVCDGSAIDRTLYADLFAVIGVAWGSGDGLTTFNLPDLRGLFVRGVDEVGTRDPDYTGRSALQAGGNSAGAVGSYQGSMYGSHSHGIFTGGHSHGASGSVVAGNFGSSGGAIVKNAASQVNFGVSVGIAGVGDLGGGTYGAGGNETRPINVSALYIIKY